MKKLFFIFSFVFSLVFIIKGQNPLSPNNDIISSFKHLSQQELLDTANYFRSKSSIDTALICYSLIINTPVKGSDIEQQERMVKAYYQSALIYQSLYDHRTSYDFLIKALTLCEKANYESYQPRIYNSIGNIYHRFNRHDLAKLYYTKALGLSQDTIVIVRILNNLGSAEAKIGNADSAFFFLDQALQISKKHNNIIFSSIMNNIALVYYNEKQYDSVFYYVRIALDEARKNNDLASEAMYLSNLGDLHFEMNKIDKALHYINLSNVIAKKNNFFQTLAKNYLLLSKIEKTKGHYKKSLEYFEMHTAIKDSVFNTEKFGEINQLQHLYEISKANQEIELLVIEQQIKDRTIHLQQIIHFILLIVLLSVSGILLFVFFQKRKLDRSYKVLFKKNLEIIELQDQLSEKESEKHRKSMLTDERQDELLDKVLTFMKDTSIICDTEFSIDKLAKLVQSNKTHVSYVINNALKKNFRSFLNTYRIREAQRLFSNPNAEKYTIEAVAFMVGFKSRYAFREAFKEITGVTPNYYLKSLKGFENEVFSSGE
ncbi:MAG: helix-turn-helix domain-containing protein [Bacteroidales bacterium]|jgi:tetratricopeptide (TPR) repeat protein/AraC-like DNA-binding protein|nr:helix-turn-helix domain-containing protein [Bacteroidales bacterium]